MKTELKITIEHSTCVASDELAKNIKAALEADGYHCDVQNTHKQEKPTQKKKG